MHNKDKGTIGELKVSLDLIKRGYAVFKDISDNSPVDLITLVKNVPIKIQVKTRSLCKKNKNTFLLECKKSAKNYHKKYSLNEVDVFSIYILEKDIILYVSSKYLLKNTSGMTFRFDDSKNNQIKSTHLYTDFLQFERALRDYTPCTLTISDEGEEIVQTETS